MESVQRAIDYIEAHLDEELELSALAEESYTSVAQLYRMFYALTGHPVKDYIRKRRMSVAAHHLRNSKRTVEDLAWDSGFESYHSFAKVFKKIVGVTPAAYRKADIYFSFEPIRLHEHVNYMEDREQSERFPDVKVIRFMPEKANMYMHVSGSEQGIEDEAIRIVTERPAANGANNSAKVRVFGHNVDLPEENGVCRCGYKVLLVNEHEPAVNDPFFTEEAFDGGLYALRKTAVKSPDTIQRGWDQLMSEWLPKSTFDLGKHQYIEEFILYDGRVTRMNLFLPVQRKTHHEPIEVVHLAESQAYYCRGYGNGAKRTAEQRLIDWYEDGTDTARRAEQGRFYMSYYYGAADADEYWWENGLVLHATEPPLEGLDSKSLGAGSYACCTSRAYGQLTGVLDNVHRWIAVNGCWHLNEERQWFAEYDASQGMNAEQYAVVKIYIPILPMESDRN